MNEIFDSLSEQLPPMIPRTKFNEIVGPFFGGATFSKGYLENLDSKGMGPQVVKIGKRVFYPKAGLIEWLRGKLN